jgi:hypothetical protein
MQAHDQTSSPIHASPNLWLSKIRHGRTGGTNFKVYGVMLISVIYVGLSLLWLPSTLETFFKVDRSVFQTHLTFVPYEQRRLELDFAVPAAIKNRSRKEILLSWMAQGKPD